MALKLKSGADLCGFVLANFCVQSESTIPTDAAYGTGRKYFHTGAGVVGDISYKYRERIWTGTEWRTSAYLDDLEKFNLVNNESFNKLKEQVDLLTGDVDTDAIISNMKEVSAFLSGFAEDASLMDLLNDKLSKSQGGTMTGMLAIQGDGTAWMSFRSSTQSFGSIGMNETGPKYWDGSAAHSLIHSGNYNTYAPKLDGTGATGTWDISVNGSARTLLTQKTWSIIDANTLTESGVNYYGWLNYTSSNLPPVASAYTNAIVTFRLHENSTFTAQLYMGDNKPLYYRSRVDSPWKALAFTDEVDLVRALAESALSKTSFDRLYAEVVTANVIDAENVYGELTGNAATATKLATARKIWGQNFDGTSDVSGNIVLPLGSSVYLGSQSDGIYITRNAILWHDSNNSYAGDKIIFSESETGFYSNVYFNSRVRIGNDTDDGSSLLQVGSTGVPFRVTTTGMIKYVVGGGGWSRGFHYTKSDGTTTLARIAANGDADALSYVFIGTDISDGNRWFDVNSSEANFHVLTKLNSRVLIGGAKDDSAYALNVKGDLHVTGNIVADGEVSAKGVAEEGDTTAGTGTVDKWTGTISTTTNVATYTHGLNSWDVIVSIYEKNGTEWNLVLADVDIVSQNAVRVLFGTTPTTEYKIVVMG